jgi:hypothetical protein
MNNFNYLFERLANINDKDHYEESKIKDIILLGKNIDESFWDNFLILLNNTDAFSILFEIPEEKISKIYRKIKKYLDNNKKDYYVKSKKTRKLL